MINIKLNAKQIQIEKAMMLGEFLKINNYNFKGFAVAINREFIPRSQYDAHLINEDDDIEIVAPMQGG